MKFYVECLMLNVEWGLIDEERRTYSMSDGSVLFENNVDLPHN